MSSPSFSMTVSRTSIKQLHQNRCSTSSRLAIGAETAWSIKKGSENATKSLQKNDCWGLVIYGNFKEYAYIDRCQWQRISLCMLGIKKHHRSFLMGIMLLLSECYLENNLVYLCWAFVTLNDVLYACLDLWPNRHSLIQRTLPLVTVAFPLVLQRCRFKQETIKLSDGQQICS